ISKVGDLLDIGVEMELIEKRGSFYSYEERRIAQGRENAKIYLKDNPEIAERIEMQIRAGEAVEEQEHTEAEDEEQEHTEAEDEVEVMA
ncbi:MAG: DNA recombination/repair protein RecA, partial [Chloroflexi bacterium]|nr:DNA recombination/repair protein RecA [Chloroflexota bacterium]